MFGRWDDRGLGNETTVFFFLIFCISHIFCNKHSFQLSWKTEAFHLDFYFNLSSSQVAKGANFKLKPLCTGSLPESESSLTSSVSSLARKLALLSSQPQPFCSAGPASPHLGAGAGITLEPLFPEPVPSSPEPQQCLSSLLSWFPFWIFPAFSFQGQMADFVKYSHFSSADLQLFKTHHPPLPGNQVSPGCLVGSDKCGEAGEGETVQRETGQYSRLYFIHLESTESA